MEVIFRERGLAAETSLKSLIIRTVNAQAKKNFYWVSAVFIRRSGDDGDGEEGE
jgi:hypothetical protein